MTSAKSVAFSFALKFVSLSILLIMALLSVIVVAGFLGFQLGATEGAIIAILAVLLFGGPLTGLGRYLGRLAVRERRN